MWKALVDLLRKKACFHDWKLVKEVEVSCIHYRFIYICQKCGEIKQIDVKWYETIHKRVADRQADRVGVWETEKRDMRVNWGASKANVWNRI